MTYDLSKPLAPQVDREMAEQISVKLGFNLDADRLDRIAKDARAIFGELGCSMAFAFGEAFDMEILLYGDPHAPKQQFIGLVNTASA